MKALAWKNIAELLAIDALAASLLFVGLQLQQDREIATAQLFADYDNTVLEWGGLVSDNGDVRIRGLKDKELYEAERAAFHTLGGTLFFEEGGRFMRARTMSSHSPSSVVNHVTQTVFKYPALVSDWRQQPLALEQEAEGYVGPLVDFANGVERVLDGLKSGETTPWGMTDSFDPM